MNLFGERPKPRLIFRLLQVEERPRVHLPRAGVHEKRRRHLRLLQHLLHLMQVNRQRLDRHANVLDKGDRLRASLQGVEAG